MDSGVFELKCPCCGAKLEVTQTGTILSHQAPKPKEIPANLREAVRRLKSEQEKSDERFQRQVEAEREHGQTLDQRFEGLLKKTRGKGPARPFPREIDLD